MKQRQQKQKKKEKNRKRETRKYEIYKVITSSAVVDFFVQIRDSALIENVRAFIIYYVIVNKTAFTTVYNITRVTHDITRGLN